MINQNFLPDPDPRQRRDLPPEFTLRNIPKVWWVETTVVMPVEIADVRRGYHEET